MDHSLTFLVLSQREAFQRQLQQEERDPRVRLTWRLEDGIPDGALVDGQSEPGYWQSALQSLDRGRPVVLVTDSHSWSERRWLAEFPNLTLLPGCHRTGRPFVGRSGAPAVDSSSGPLRGHPPLEGLGVTYQQPQEIWQAFEDSPPDVALFHLDE